MYLTKCGRFNDKRQKNGKWRMGCGCEWNYPNTERVYNFS